MNFCNLIAISVVLMFVLKNIVANVDYSILSRRGSDGCDLFYLYTIDVFEVAYIFIVFIFSQFLFYFAFVFWFVSLI